jgi:hypothetical protein
MVGSGGLMPVVRGGLVGKKDSAWVERAKWLGIQVQRFWWVFGIGVVVVAYIMGQDGVGHLPFQIASTPQEAADVIIDHFDDLRDGFGSIRSNIILDLSLFIWLYVLAGVGAILTVRKHWYVVPQTKTIGLGLVLALVLAGIFDYIETFAIWSYLPSDSTASDLIPLLDAQPPQEPLARSMLAMDISSTATHVGTAFALPKFVALAMVGLYVVPGLLGLLWRQVGSLVNGFTLLESFAFQKLDPPEKWSGVRPVADKSEPKGIGMCFSGGGIRAGSFALGGLQLLEQEGVVKKADTITAVSGGGYLLGAYEMARTRGVFKTDPLSQPRPYAIGSPEEDFVRRHSAYLAHTFGQKMAMVGQLLLGITLNTAAFFLVLYVVLRPIGWALFSVNDGLVTSDGVQFSIPTAHWIAMAIPAGLAVIAFVVTLMPIFTGQGARLEGFFFGGWALMGWAVAVTLWLLLLPVAVWFTFSFVPYLFRVLPGIDEAGGETTTGAVRIVSLFFSAGALTFIGNAVVRQLKSLTLTLQAILAVVVVAPVLALYVIASFVRGAMEHGISGKASPFGWEVEEVVFFLLLFIGMVLWFMVSDQRSWSMHRFYKRRLAKAFSVERNSAETAQMIPYEEPTDFNTPAGEPKFVSVAVANVRDYGVAPPGLAALPFNFSAEAIGSDVAGYVAHDALASRLEPKVRRRDMTVPAAVAISGAAISPAMGKQQVAMVRALLAYANVRLGVWFPNPRWFNANSGQWFERPRITYLFKEIFGIHSIDDRFLYLTDGGHIDNLGLVELLRGRPEVVFAFDASGGKPGTFGTIGQAIALARAELGIEIDIPLQDMRPDDADVPHGESGALSWSSATKAKRWQWSRDRNSVGGLLVREPYAIGEILYPSGNPHKPHVGHLIYIQAAATPADMPWDLRAYWERNPDFPNDSTIDQNFEYDEFEAYRKLGFWASEKAYAGLPPPIQALV